MDERNERVEWDPSLETGISIVDEQHRSLFRQVGVLLDPGNADRVEETLAFLGDYFKASGHVASGIASGVGKKS